MFEFGELINYQDLKVEPTQEGRLNYKSVKIPAMKSLMMSDEERMKAFIIGVAQDYSRYTVKIQTKGWDLKGFVIIDIELIPRN